MNSNLWKYLVCPQCKKKLTFLEWKDDVLNGFLYCEDEHYYPIFHQVPVLMDENLLFRLIGTDEIRRIRQAWEVLKINYSKINFAMDDACVLSDISDNWSFQWQNFKTENTVFEDEATFREHIPYDSSDLGRDLNIILEIGCGNGRDIKHVIEDRNMIFGIDISESAYYAQRRYENAGNVCIIRCDVNKLPFASDTFDLIYSDHVLQHIDNLENCFNEVKRVINGRGKFVFNLYSQENNFVMTKIIEPLKKIILSKLPVKTVLYISNVPAVLLYASIKTIYLPLYKYFKALYKKLPLSSHMIFWLPMSYNTLKMNCFDLLHAPIANYFSGHAIDQLCRKTNLRLGEKYILRQTLWVCKGKFDKA